MCDSTITDSTTTDSTITDYTVLRSVYMQVEEWYGKRETLGLGDKGKRAVYLATDDSHLILEAQRK